MKIRLLSCVIALGCLKGYSQDAQLTNLFKSAESMWYLDFEKTNHVVKQAERLVEKVGLRGNEILLIRFYNLRIQSCDAFSRLQLWRQYVKELDVFLSANKTALPPNEYISYRLENELAMGQYYFSASDYERALEILVKLASEIKQLAKSEEVCDRLTRISGYIAAIHSLKGEYEASVNQYKAGLPYWECAATKGSDFSVVYRNIGTTYFKEKDYKNAAKYLKLAEQSVEVRLKRDPLGGARVALSLYETQASYYEQTGSHDSAMVSMQKALPLLKLKNVGDAFKGRISLGLGDLYYREGEFSAAQIQYREAEKFFLNTSEDQAVHLSSLYLSEGELNEKREMIDQALRFYTRALERLVLNFKPDGDGNPVLDGLISKKLVFKVLQKKSRLHERLFNQKQDVNDLVRAYKTNQLSLALLDSTSNETSLDRDKVILAEDSYGAFEDGIRMAHSLYQQTHEPKYQAECFALIDKSKGIVLLEKLRRVDRFAGINPELVEREKEIKSELFLTEQRLYTLELENRNQTELAASRERYANLKRDYADWMRKIKNEAPGYYRLRFDHGVIKAADIQNKLIAKGEALLEYFVGDAVIAVAGFTNKNQVVVVKKLPADFPLMIDRFRAAVTGGGAENIKDFEKESAALYDLLIKDVLQQLGPEVTSLTIIPDGILGYLPFEVLRKDAGGETNYLIEELSIRYAYSATYLHEQSQKKSSHADHFFAGFVSSNDQSAISYDRSRKNRFSSLPGAEKEVKAITELLGTSFSVFSPAHKSDFKEHASDYQVLHLAMHSQVNNENPMLSILAFSGADGDTTDVNELTAIELYSMSLKSDLVVLSACNTGFGALHRGEGIMSFSRAFAYAGVPSAVISLWQVPDKATSKIMVNFYQYLKAGEGKDRALQHAKLDFIRDYPQMAAPFYWAGFVLTGSKQPLQFPSSWLWYWITAGLLIVTSSLFIARHFKKRTPVFNREL